MHIILGLFPSGILHPASTTKPFLALSIPKKFGLQYIIGINSCFLLLRPFVILEDIFFGFADEGSLNLEFLFLF